MTRHGLRRRMSALGTVVGLGVTLPFALSATPAHAQPILSVDKSHEGNFARGGQGVYTITVTNSGDEPPRRSPSRTTFPRVSRLRTSKATSRLPVTSPTAVRRSLAMVAGVLPVLAPPNS